MKTAARMTEDLTMVEIAALMEWMEARIHTTKRQRAKTQRALAYVQQHAPEALAQARRELQQFDQSRGQAS